MLAVPMEAKNTVNEHKLGVIETSVVKVNLNAGFEQFPNKR